MRRSLAIALLVLAGCGSPSTSTGAPMVDMQEFTVAASGVFVSGTNEITVANSGEFGHTLVISDATGQVIDATPVIGPGETYDMTADLATGEYELSCRIVIQTDDGRLVDHYHEGMLTTISVVDS